MRGEGRNQTRGSHSKLWVTSVLAWSLVLVVLSCRSDRAGYVATYVYPRYVVTSVDPDMFEPWVVIRLVSPGGEFYVVSEADTLKAQASPSPDWERIEAGKTYRLAVVALDSLPYIERSFFLRGELPEENTSICYDGDWDFEIDTWRTVPTSSVFWESGKVIKPLFRSLDIRGEYVRVGRRVNR